MQGPRPGTRATKQVEPLHSGAELAWNDMARRGSEALLRAIWRLGAAKNCVPGMTRDLCARLLEAGR